MTQLEIAIGYANRGWRVIPIRPGEKHPPIPRWQEAATTNTETLVTWWTGPYANHGIGIATGPASGIFVLDIDDKEGQRGYDTLADLEAEHGPLPETLTVITGSGGNHLYFAYPPTQTIRNDHGRRLGSGLDIRGEGGQVVAPGSTHPNGTTYEFDIDTEHLNPQPAPEWLLTLLQDPEPPTPPTNTTNTTQDTTDGPAARYNNRTNWTDLLNDDGWTLAYTDRAGEQHWVRPGKDPSDGTSATVGYQGQDFLRVFTSSIPWLPENAYSRFGYYAARQHNGDRSAAARHLHQIENQAITTSLHNFQLATHPTSPDEPWPTPIPLGNQRQKLPTFPIHTLPNWIAEHAQAVADELQMEVDLPANLALIALATIAAKSTTVHVSGRWTEPLNVYIAIAMPPSAGKSPAFSYMTGPIRRHEEEIAEAAAQTLEFKAQKKRMIEKRMAKAEAADDNDEARRALMELLDLGDLTPPRLTADDATPEALTQLLAEQNGRIAILSTEGGLFDLMTGRYSDKANLDVYLKGWSGDTIAVDRIGRGQSKVTNPALTIGLTVQPTVIAALADKPELAGRGLTARFMYALPTDNVGNRDFLNPTPTDPAIITKYDRELTKLAKELHATSDAQITLHPETHHLFLTWKQELEHQRKPDGELRPLAEWSTKLESTTIRTAGLLHIAYGHSPNGIISPETMRQAIEIGNYWIAHAHAVHDLWGHDPNLTKARIVLDFAKGKDSFTIRDLYSNHRRLFPRADETIGPLSVLIERGWIRPVDNEWPPRLGVRGKESPTIAVHPAHAVHAVHAVGKTTSEDPEKGSHAVHAVHVLRDLSQITHSLTTQEQENKEPCAHEPHEPHDYSQAPNQTEHELEQPEANEWIF
jgi:hypothetical protein